MQRITLGVQRSTGDYDYYPSLIMDFVEGKSVMTGVPAEQGHEVMVRADTPVVIDVAAGPAVMRYRSHVVGRNESPLSLSLAWPTKSERVQRRNHFRVEVGIPVEFRIEEDDKVRRGKGTTIDLSAGGMRLRLSEALREGTVLELKLHIEADETLECVGRVVRSGEIEGARSTDRFWNGIIFQGATEGVLREITRHVMDIQREQMKKGAL